MPKKKYPRLEHCFICDDIRKEIGGKTSLMGIYHHDIFVPIPYTFLKLCFRFIFSNITAIENFTIQLIDPDKKVISKSKSGPIENPPKDQPQNLILDIEVAGVQISKEGQYEIVIGFNKDKAKRGLKFNIKKKT